MSDGSADGKIRRGSAEVIGRLISAFGAKSYLEVGVNQGVTFVAVEAALREGVDPRFRFDWAAQQGPATRLFQETSDRYFDRFPREKQERFDLIFLDGLHTFEQTYRDFLNTLETSHSRTIWLIDDTAPSDAFSISQDQHEAVELRRMAANSTIKSGAWQGDVFKVIFAIHDFLPAFSFATTTKGKIQTIAWKARRREVTPLFNSLETITRMSYLDFLKHRPSMNSMPLDQIISRIQEDWGLDGI